MKRVAFALTIVLFAVTLLVGTGGQALNERPPCNLPPVHWPDGCPDAPSISPPADPIPPPCIQAAYTETDLESYDVPTLRLVLVVEHPEYGPGLIDRVYFVREPLTGATQSPVWRFDYRHDWDAACGKDEAPLAWAVDQLLAGDLTALSIYTAPLPADLLNLLADLGGWQLLWVYLPLVQAAE